MYCHIYLCKYVMVFYPLFSGLIVTKFSFKTSLPSIALDFKVNVISGLMLTSYRPIATHELKQPHFMLFILSSFIPYM